MNAKPSSSPAAARLRRRAEVQLRKKPKTPPAANEAPRSAADPLRLLHELQVHQIELEMQNAELRQTRDKLELVLENYTDLYGFAPVGYFTLTTNGTIQLANLTGAHLAGIECSRLVGQYFGTLVCPEHRPRLASFLKQVFAGDTRQSLDVDLLSHGGPARTVNIRAQRLLTEPGCRAVVMDISDRKRAEAATAQLAAMVNSSSDAIVGKDLNGIITSWNSGAEKIFGYAASDIVGSPVTRLIPADRQSEEESIMRRIRQGRSVDSYETVRLTEDGRPLDMSLTVSPIWDGNGKIIGASKVARDITAHKRAEDIVRVSEIRYRRLFEAAHDGVLLLDPATRKITDANPFMTKLLGYRHDQLVGKELFEIGLLKDEADSQIMFRKLKRSHEVRYEDLPLKSRDGRHQEVEVVANLYQENGRAVIQCNVRDITARKRTEQELAEKARLLDLSHDAIIVRDVAGRIRYWNHGAEELYGWSRQEALGKTSTRLLKTRFAIPFKQMLKELYQTDRWIGEISHVKRDGQRITVLARMTLDRDPQGHPTAVLETITDITARKLAETAQRRVEVLAGSNLKLENEIVRRRVLEASLKQSEQHQRKLLAESREMQEQLRQLSREILRAQEEERKRISRELHDVIAQTLTGITVRLATLKKEAGRTGDSFERNLARTQEIVGKSVAIVHQFARELRPAVLDDLGLIPALHSFLNDFAARTGLQVRLTAFAEVEEIDIAKRTVLFRVAQEALTNVARHAHASQVKVILQKQPDRLCLKVTDDGRAFNLENFLRHRGGKHLGLLGMKERLEMIGGSFAIESKPGKGTTIEAQVPLPPPPGGQTSRRGKIVNPVAQCL